MSEKPNIWNEIFNDKGRVFEEVHPDFERFVEKMETQRGRRILDLGCGSGRHLVALRKLGFEVVGLDGAPQGLALAQEWLNRENLSAELYLQSMFDRYPFPDDFFDGVLSIQVIHHGYLKQVQAAAREVERVLKPGGLIWVTVTRGNRPQGLKSMEVEPNTFIPLDGYEKGLPHHVFSPESFAELFPGCDILEQYEDGKNHRALWGIRR